MSQVPGLKYIFCVARAYPIENLVALWHYMNKAGVTVDILAGAEDVLDCLRENDIQFNELRELPADYDVMISNCIGFFPFTRYWLEKSLQAGKINVNVVLPSLVTRYGDQWFVPKKWKLMHALCVGDMQTINKRREHNKEVLYLNTGVPAHDFFSTSDFQTEVARVRQRYGDKLLVIGLEGNGKEHEKNYGLEVIRYAESFGFKVVVQIHSGREHVYGDTFSEYTDPGIDRYALFVAASHVISALYSILITECFYFGTKVACKPLALHYEKWRDFRWLNDPHEWNQWARSFFDKELVNTIPLVHDVGSLNEFLSSSEPNMSSWQAQDYFGWPRVENYCENTFRMLDMYLGSENEGQVQKIKFKNEIYNNTEIDFTFHDTADNISKFNGINDKQGFMREGIRFLKEGDAKKAQCYLERAAMFSGTEHYGFVQYALALCCLKLNNIQEAQKHICQSLFVEPNCREYQELKRQIDATEKPSYSSIT